MRASRFALLAVALFSFGGASCGPPAAAPTVSMRMAGDPPSARVTVDDIYIGSLAFVAGRGVALPVGQHRITVEAPGFFPWDALVSAKEGDPLIHLDVHLLRVPE